MSRNKLGLIVVEQNKILNIKVSLNLICVIYKLLYWSRYLSFICSD